MNTAPNPIAGPLITGAAGPKREPSTRGASLILNAAGISFDGLSAERKALVLRAVEAVVAAGGL